MTRVRFLEGGEEERMNRDWRFFAGVAGEGERKRGDVIGEISGKRRREERGKTRVGR